MAHSTSTSDGPAPETNWSLIIAAQTPAPEYRSALERLCRLYWQPLYVYARQRGLTVADAEDATQSFFAKILAQDWLAQVDRSKGRFRGFLFQSMSFHLGEVRRYDRAQRRGGAVVHIPLDIPAAEEAHLRTAGTGVDAAASFDHAWACTVLGEALAQLSAEETAAGRGARLEALRPFLTQPPTTGDYERLAETLGIARPTVAVLVHRLGKRYRELIRAVVADTLAEPGDLEGELRHLLQSFAPNSTPT
jgi:RNA polymerase sigma-70 factor (ECF subfamily)